MYPRNGQVECYINCILIKLCVCVCVAILKWKPEYIINKIFTHSHFWQMCLETKAHEFYPTTSIFSQWNTFIPATVIKKYFIFQHNISIQCTRKTTEILSSEEKYWTNILPTSKGFWKDDPVKGHMQATTGYRYWGKGAIASKVLKLSYYVLLFPSVYVLGNNIIIYKL